MESFFRYMRGFLRIRITGSGAIRFMNLCTAKNISIWDLEEDCDYVYLNISLADFRKIRKIVRTSKVKAAVIKRNGLPFLLKDLYKRRMFILFLLFFVLLMHYQRTHLWSVSVEGNTTITYDRIMDFLLDTYYAPGMKIQGFPKNEAEKSMRNAFPEISWICISTEGTVLNVSLIENIGESPSEDDFIPSSVYAAEDGIVKRLLVGSGTPMVKVGDEVKKGDLLISGIVGEDNLKAYGKSPIFTEAKGDYICEITVPYYNEIKREEMTRFYDEKRKTTIGLLNKNLNTAFFNKTKKENETILKIYHKPAFFQYYDYFPFFVKTIKSSFIQKKVSLTDEELDLRLYENLAVFIRSLEEKGVQNIQKNVKITNSNNGRCMYGELIYESSATESIPIELQIRTEIENGQYDSVEDGIND